MERREIRNLLNPALASAGIAVATMQSALSENLTTTVLTSQAKLLFPSAKNHDERVGHALEYRVRALAQAAAAAALALARLPQQTAKGLVPAPTRRGSPPPLADPKLIDIVETVMDAYVAGTGSGPETTDNPYERLMARFDTMRAKLQPHMDTLEQQDKKRAIRMLEEVGAEVPLALREGL